MPVIAIILLAAVAVFFGCLVGTLVGALSGWVVGLVFTDTLHLLAKALGMPEAAAWQLGAMLGFIGGFLRSSVTTKE